MSTNILNLPTEETLQSIATALTTMQGNVSGVKGNEETTYRTGQVNLTAANIGALPANTTYVTSVNGQSGVITGLATTSDLNTVRLIAEGAGAAVSFASYTSMVSNLNNAAATDYKVGQSIYIATLDVPDLWVFEVSENQILYYYTDDAAFKTLLASQGYVQVGYCKLAALETQKVDLSNHATLNTQQTFTSTKSFTDFSLINDYTNNKTLASYLSGKVDTNADSIFNVINASDIASNTLTQAQYDLIINGKPTLIKGELLGYSNPEISCPTITGTLPTDSLFAVIKGHQNNKYATVYGILQINVQTKVISLYSGGQANYLIFDFGTITFKGGLSLGQANSSVSIKGKDVVGYYLNNVYAYATNSTTELKYETINNFSISADTTFTLATAPNNTYPEYKANITNTDTSNAITITLPSGTVIKGNVTISSNTFEIPADSSVEVNIQNGKAIVVNWGA